MTQSASDVLLPCPDCEGEVVTVGLLADPTMVGGCQACCGSCGVCGPERPNERLAIESWNAMPRSAAEAVEPVAWQWSDFSGKWYTVDTARMSLVDQEALARACAKDHEGRVRPLFAAPPSVEVAVKALEWTATDYWPGIVAYEAEVVGLSYYIIERAGGYDVACRSLGFNLGTFPSLNEAKAAAQADYEARIRSGLASPVAAEQTQPGLELAARWHDAQAVKAKLASVEAAAVPDDAKRLMHELTAQAHENYAAAIRSLAAKGE